jgi:mannose-6-phosphate isomerase-like protein (cupin superfamily)
MIELMHIREQLMKTWFVLVLSLVLASAAAVPAAGQGSPPPKPPAAPPQAPAQQPPVQPPPKASRPANPNARLSVTLFVTDPSGAPVPGVTVRASGPIDREGVTTREGTVKLQGLRAGDYRLHFEADGFVTLEKDMTLRGGAPEIEVSLTRAPAPPKPPEPAPGPKPAPAGTAAPLAPADPNATIEIVSVVEWLAKNKLERGEPRREGVVSRTPNESTAVLQVRDALRDRVHPDSDEVMYVINGSASLSSKGRMQTIETGTVLLIPRGVSVTIENRGREPLWALSILSPAGQPKP